MKRNGRKLLNITAAQVKHGVHRVLSRVDTMASVMNQYSQSEDSVSVFLCINNSGTLRPHSRAQKPQ